MFSLILADLRAKAEWCYEGRDWRRLTKALLTDGTLAMVLYRMAQQSRRWRLWPLEMILGKANLLLCGCVIGRGAEFGPGFVLIHSIGVVINGSVRGGADVKIEHQVTLGAERRSSPVIGNNVFFGAGCKVIGAVHIGDGSKIGANAVVIEDVPAGTTAVGVPARIVRRPGSAADGAQLTSGGPGFSSPT